MRLEKLREQVLDANLELVRRGLVLSTFGNASGVARKEGLIVIKPSGVPYERMKPKDLVVIDLHGAKTRSSRAPVGDEKRGIFLAVGEIRWEKRASFTTADAQFVGVGDAQLDGVAIADATIAFTRSCSQGSFDAAYSACI